MVKSMFFAVIFLSPLVSLANGKGDAQQSWKCTFSGESKESKGENKVQFNGTLDWVGSEDSWEVNGKSENSTFSGSCSDSKCEITETMNSKDIYYWEGTYSTKIINDEKSKEVLKGTWGPSEDDRESSGTYELTATCKLVK